MTILNPFAKRVKADAVLKAFLAKYISCLSTVIVFFCCIQGAAYAQITITTTPADISSAIAGQNFDALISATAANGNPVSLSVSSNINPASGLSFDNLNPPAGTSLHLHGNNPVVSPTISDWSFDLIATATGEAATAATFTVQVRKPIDLFLVLDKSGSMTTFVSGGTDTRWNALSNGVNSFFSIYQPKLTTTGNASGDQLGIRMFSSADAPPVNAPFNVNQFIPVMPTTSLTTVLNGDSPGGSTAMGSGLLSARNFLFPGGADNGHKKAMLLFTDGEQNIPPNVVVTPGSNPTVSGTDLTNGDKIQIHTIGLGVPGPATQLLYNIAHESNGISNIANDLPTTAPDLNLTSYLNNISVRLFSGSTPQFVDVRRNRFKLMGSVFGAEETFAVSKRIETIFVSVLSQVVNESQAFVSDIEKDGQKLSLFDSSYIKSIRGNGWQTFIISVSGIKKKIPAFTSDGNWTIRASNRSQSAGPYIMSLIVDDHNSEMIGKTTQTKELVVGDRLPLSIELTKNGKPLSGANAIAIVGQPKDIGDILARTRADFSIDTSADADNPGTQKLKALLKDSAFAKLLLDSNHVVNLTFNATQKKYVGEFTHLDASGVYQVVYQVAVNDTTLGQINRYAEESVYARFPDVNLDGSAIHLDSTSQAGISTLTFRPIGINGKFIGPGWASAITLTGTNTKITKVVDNTDGSYVLTVDGSLTEDVTLSIGTAKIYTGKLADIVKNGGTGGNDIFKQWWFWVIVLIILIIIIYLASRKKKTP